MTDINETTENAAENKSYVIHIDNFDGPLDLLWELIKKSKIDIAEVSLSPITQQYLDYLRVMEKMNVAIATDFIRMASELLYYKSCTLLPASQIEDEFFVPPLPPELVQKLLEFKKFQLASRKLLEVFESGADRLTRENRASGDIEPDETAEYSLFDLLKAFVEFMESIKSVEEREIIFDEILIGDRMEHITNLLRDKEVIQFDDIFSRKPSRMEIVVSFMAILELARTKILKIVQNTIYGVIRIVRKDGSGKE
jgi:segregation and condensation protein A